MMPGRRLACSEMPTTLNCSKIVLCSFSFIDAVHVLSL